MKTRTVGQAGLRGWRESVADVAAAPVAKRSGFSEDQVRAAIGGIFLLLSVMYVVKSVTALVQEQRS